MASRYRLVLAACFSLWLGGAATAAERIAITGPAPERSAAAKPKYCSKREHLGVLGQLVDQAWVIYRRLEISSPQREGWCGCAQRCEPIDELAAAYEASAYAAREASRNLSLSSEERGELIERSIELFGERNDMVDIFNGCIDRMRPPLARQQAPDERDVLAALRDPHPIGCTKSDLPLKQRWALWCREFVQKNWLPIANDFSKEFADKGFGTWELHVPLMATDDGKISQNGPEVFTTNIPKEFRDGIRKRLAAIKTEPFPDGTKLGAFSWVSTMRVDVVKGVGPPLRSNREMPCPQN